MARSTLEELEHSLASVVRSLADRATAHHVAKHSGYDLPPVSWTLLEHLDARGPLRVSDIAACHGVDISSVSPRLKKLENAGLVTRDRVPTDARSFHISITPEGSGALACVHATRRSMIEQAADEIDTTDLTVATKVLSQLSARLAASPTTTRE